MKKIIIKDNACYEIDLECVKKKKQREEQKKEREQMRGKMRRR